MMAGGFGGMDPAKAEAGMFLTVRVRLLSRTGAFPGTATAKIAVLAVPTELEGSRTRTNSPEPSGQLRT